MPFLLLINSSWQLTLLFPVKPMTPHTSGDQSYMKCIYLKVADFFIFSLKNKKESDLINFSLFFFFFLPNQIFYLHEFSITLMSSVKLIAKAYYVYLVYS